MPKRSIRLFGAGLLLACAALLGACGGGGGGGGGGTAPTQTISGGGFAPATGPGDTSGYFPSAAGDEWLFNASGTNAGAATAAEIVSLAVNGTKTVLGASATVFTTTDTSGATSPFDQYFDISGGGVTTLGNTNASDTITPLIVPYVQQLFPVEIGQISAVTAQNIAEGSDSGGNPITLNLNQTIANSDFETVEVPAGVFANALKQSTTITAAVLDNGQSAPLSGTENTWYVAGIGEVKDVSSTSGAASTITTDSELRGYTVNGVQHGFGAIGIVDGSLAPSGCGGAPAGAPAVGSDGTNFLLVAHECAVTGGAAAWNWFGTLIGPGGATISTFNISTPGAINGGSQAMLHAAIAFDGTNYLVAFEDDSTSFAETIVDSVLISPAGALVSTPAQIATAHTSSNVHTDDMALAFDGSHYLLVYLGATGALSPAPVVGIFIAPGTGQPTGPAFTISSTAAYAGSPALAFDGSNYLAAWEGNQFAPMGLYAARISMAGAILDATPIEVVDGSAADLANSCCDFAPALSFGGGTYLVAYRDTRGESTFVNGDASISASRIGTNGVMTDGSATTPGIVVTTSKANPKGRVRIAFIDGSYLLVWETDQALNLAATRIAPATGAVSASWPEGFALVPALDTIGFPAMGTSLSGAYLAWLNRSLSPISVTALGGLPIFPAGP